MIVSNSKVTFRIDVEFPGCEVDMVYKGLAASGVRTPVPSILCDAAQISIDKSKLKNTPTEASVRFCLSWLAGYVDRNEMCTEDSKWEKDYSHEPITAYTEDGIAYTTWPDVKTELEEIGVEVEDWYPLMMGSCHLNCSCSPEQFSQELVNKANKIVEDIFNKYCVYYG